MGMVLFKPRDGIAEWLERVRPMRQRSGSNAIVELRGYWRRWMNVVELFARRRRARRWVNPSSYAAVHTDLIEACRSLSSMVDDDEREYFENLEYIARPWVSTKSLQLTNREVLADLLTRCRQVERELGGHGLVLPTLHHSVRVLLTVMATAGVVFLIWTAGESWLPIFGQSRNWSGALVMCFDRTRYVHHLLIPGILVVSASSYIVSRRARH